jgi:hypothetical protein
MNIPGFTAEFSLNETGAPYRILRIHCSTESVPQHAITTQFIHRPPVDCDFMQCSQQGGYIFCYCG